MLTHIAHRICTIFNWWIDSRETKNKGRKARNHWNHSTEGYSGQLILAKRRSVIFFPHFDIMLLLPLTALVPFTSALCEGRGAQVASAIVKENKQRKEIGDCVCVHTYVVLYIIIANKTKNDRVKMHPRCSTDKATGIRERRSRFFIFIL
uniref:Uncharacterized protein n=1 Tax=Trypanosoma congolense (strain IL3000) TaxID=1068625 RepID=G0UTN7_TRYCI|nr:hypothetical protein, unlikely [Trypanosoma congolense IL3000]